MSTQSAQPSPVVPTDIPMDPIGDIGVVPPPMEDIPRKRLFSGHGALRIKYAADRLVAIIALLVLAPLFAAIAIAVRLSSPGPVFFVHKRIGINGEPFQMWKFRSMKAGTEDQLVDLLRADGRDGEPFFKVPDDPRVTGLGRWLRRWSLDELPQLWNVVLGQMSLIGPRPQVDAEVALYTGRELDRLTVRPGLTGLWQISGRSALPKKEAMELDLRYVREWSLILDTRILFKTLGAVINGRGAL